MSVRAKAAASRSQRGPWAAKAHRPPSDNILHSDEANRSDMNNVCAFVHWDLPNWRLVPVVLVLDLRVE